MDQEKLNQLGPILRALRGVAEDPLVYSGDLDNADRRFAEALAAAIAVEKAHAEASRSGSHGKQNAVFRALFPPKTSKEAWRRLQTVLELTDRQVALATRAGVLVTGRDGQIRLRDVALMPRNAIAYLFISGALMGYAFASMVFEEVVGLGLIVRGLELGLMIGAVAALVLNHSFRLYPILDKLDSVKPWLSPDSGPNAAH